MALRALPARLARCMRTRTPHFAIVALFLVARYSGIIAWDATFASSRFSWWW
jgi:hypothetical protein